MLQGFKSYLLFGNTFCGVEHTNTIDASIINLTLLNKSKKELNLSKTQATKSVKEVSKLIHKNQHIFLIINNEHVLTKSTKAESPNDSNLVNKVFPNINISEFYYEILEQKDITFVSICRKTYVNNLIEEYTENNLGIINFSLGNLIINNIASFVKNEQVSTSNATITFNNSIIKSINSNDINIENTYDINGLKIQSKSLLSFAGALNIILNSRQLESNFIDYRYTLLNKHKHLRFFSQFLKIGLGFILGLLIINFLTFNFYFEKVQSLNETSQINQTAKANIIKLNETVSKAKKITEDMLKSNSSKSSLFINNIITSLPESILLSEIIYQPLKKSIKKDKSIELNENIIIIAGESNNSDLYSQWVVSLEKMNWINTIEVMDYSDSKTKTSHFTIKLRLI